MDAKQSAAPEMVFEERRSSRRSFLRKAGITLAVGLGGSLALARPAHAQNAHCCQNPCRQDCPSGRRPFWCVDCDGSTCCQCLTSTLQCANVGCGGCGG
jgi:hypothetical protein